MYVYLYIEHEYNGHSEQSQEYPSVVCQKYDFVSQGCRSESNYGQNPFILQFLLALRSPQLDLTNRNGINHDLNLANALF